MERQNQNKRPSLTGFLRNNSYPMTSIILLCLYVMVFALLVAFVARSIRTAFNTDITAQNAAVSAFDVENYQKLEKRFQQTSGE